MAEPQRRPGERTGAYTQRKSTVSGAESETARQKRADTEQAWAARYKAETGQEATGIANAGKFNSWREKKRRDAQTRRSMKDAGDALASSGD